MLYVALAELGLLALTLYGSWAAMRAQQREQGRRLDALVDRMLHLSGNPWNIAPADEFIPPKPDLYDEDGELILDQYTRFTTSPEQEP